MRLFKNERQTVVYLDLVALALCVCNVYLWWMGESVGDNRTFGSFVPLIRAGACVVFMVGFTWKGAGFIRFFIPIYALIILYWNRYFNYTSFLLIMICYHKHHKDGMWMYPLYIADAIASLLINSNLTPAHAIIHFSGCAGIVILYLMFFTGGETKPAAVLIVADKDEEYLLNGLAEGKQQKELIKEGLHKSTISSKLNNLKTRYGCRNIEELVIRWSEQDRSNPEGSGPNPEHKNKS